MGGLGINSTWVSPHTACDLIHRCKCGLSATWGKPGFDAAAAWMTGEFVIEVRGGHLDCIICFLSIRLFNFVGWRASFCRNGQVPTSATWVQHVKWTSELLSESYSFDIIASTLLVSMLGHHRLPVTHGCVGLCDASTTSELADTETATKISAVPPRSRCLSCSTALTWAAETIDGYWYILS